jgi:hypothetical protein
LKCHSTWKLCPMKNCTTFVLGEIEVFRWNLENAEKVLERFKDIMGFDQYLIRIWPLVSVDLIRRVISTN